MRNLVKIKIFTNLKERIMNAKIMKAAFVAAIAVVASYGVYANLKADNMSDLMLANVEALASGESGQNVYCCGNYGDCMLILGGGVVKGIKFFSPCP
nr:NVEALA domain-containing protein [uncultured Bacteroides sp.]